MGYPLNRRLIRAVLGLTLLISGVVLPSAVADNSYGSGTYGRCQYNSCGISLTSNGTVNLDIIPGTNPTCTVASDTVSVLTDSSTGYTLKVADTDTDNHLNGAAHGQTFAAVSGSAGAPASLSASKWGYRVDGTSGFGAGPTSGQSNGGVPSGTYAAIPLSSGTADTIASSSGPANPAVNTTVWYGLCASSTSLSDTYSDSITYTAVVN